MGSLIFIIIFGLKPGIDFTGGSISEIEYKAERPSNQEIKESLADFDLGEIYIQPTGEKGVILRMGDISENVHREIIKKLSENNKTGIPSSEETMISPKIEELRFESIGPVIGRELKEKTKIVVVLALLAIVLYIAFAFRRLSWPAKSWQYGLASLIALFHDILIPLGVFSILGKFYGFQITIPVIVAFLTVVGYSINNTVVVFDRIRENLLKKQGATYKETVDISLNQTLTRSFNTSFTTLLVLTALFLIGGETLKYFALALILGITAGTYSSIFLAGPILVAWLSWRKKI